MKNANISVQRLPIVSCALKIARSSKCDQGSFTMFGSNWFLYLHQYLTLFEKIKRKPSIERLTFLGTVSHFVLVSSQQLNTIFEFRIPKQVSGSAHLPVREWCQQIRIHWITLNLHRFGPWPSGKFRLIICTFLLLFRMIVAIVHCEKNLWKRNPPNRQSLEVKLFNYFWFISFFTPTFEMLTGASKSVEPNTDHGHGTGRWPTQIIHPRP